MLEMSSCHKRRSRRFVVSLRHFAALYLSFTFCSFLIVDNLFEFDICNYGAESLSYSCVWLELKFEKNCDLLE